MSSLKHLKVSGEENIIKRILFTNIEKINQNTKKFIFFQENIICFQNIFFTLTLLFGIYYLLVNISFPIEKIESAYINISLAKFILGINKKKLTKN